MQGTNRSSGAGDHRMTRRPALPPEIQPPQTPVTVIILTYRFLRKNSICYLSICYYTSMLIDELSVDNQTNSWNSQCLSYISWQFID